MCRISDFIENKKALEEFLLDIEILDQLESKLANFNVFETLGLVNYEIRHSNVLAWLLNPNENHGLGDIFVKKFVQGVYQGFKDNFTNNQLSLFDISLMDYYDFNVLREWRNIDVFAISERNKLAIVIENKVWSKESSHQLEKYFNIVNEEYPDFNKIYLFLTPYGDSASDEEKWISVDYGFVVNNIEKALELKKSSINPEVKMFIGQYLEILRRYIVGNNELEKICREIYFKHKKALDLIVQYIPDVYSEIGYYIETNLKDKPEIIMEDSTKTNIRFTTPTVDNSVKYRGCKEWTKSERILLFDIQNRNDKVVIKLIIGPGDSTVRENLFKVATNNKDIFKGSLNTLTGKWTQIYAKDLIPKNSFNKDDVEAMKEKLEKELDKFISGDLKKIEEKISLEYA